MFINWDTSNRRCFNILESLKLTFGGTASLNSAKTLLDLLKVL